MIDILLILVIPVIAIVVAVILYVLFPRSGSHYTSRLTCTKCGRTFDYNWVPGGSFSAVRLGKKRYVCCLNCHKWSTLVIWNTKIDEDKAQHIARSIICCQL